MQKCTLQLCSWRVIQEVDISVVVDSPCQADTGPLPPAQPNPSFPYRSQATTGKASYILMGEERVEGELVCSDLDRLPVSISQKYMTLYIYMLGAFVQLINCTVRCSL